MFLGFYTNTVISLIITTKFNVKFTLLHLKYFMSSQVDLIKLTHEENYAAFMVP
jgi:hypothetical protein